MLFEDSFIFNDDGGDGAPGFFGVDSDDEGAYNKPTKQPIATSSSQEGQAASARRRNRPSSAPGGPKFSDDWARDTLRRLRHELPASFQPSYSKCSTWE